MTVLAEASDAAPNERMTRSSAAPTEQSDRRREAMDVLRFLIAGLALALVVRIVAVQPFTIPSSSMEPGLVTGDYIVVSKFAYGWSTASLPFDPPMRPGRVMGRTPARGDVVVFRRPSDTSQVWIKRVIGLPGDTVQARGGQVFVNGRAVRRTAMGQARDHDAPDRPVSVVRETLDDGRSYSTYDRGFGQPGDDTPAFHVPAGQLFVMGDNRDNSLDSRWPGDVGVGLLPSENLIGRAEFVLASWRPGASLLKPWTWVRLQTDRLLRPIR